MARGRGKSSSSNSNLTAASIGFLGGNMTSSSGNTSIGDGIKYGIKCESDDNSSYCQNVRWYNQFQMIFTIISTIVGSILFLIFLYYVYKLYSKEKRK
jgi:hypothetical protein